MEKNNKIEKLYNILMNDKVENSIKKNLTTLIDLIPEIKSMINFEHKHPHHHLNVFHHTLYALSLSEKNFDIRISLLLHDIGKPYSFTEENNIRHYNNHAEISSKMSRIILTRLGFEKDYIDKICYLIKFHDTRISKSDIIDNYQLSYTRYLIQKCDCLAHNPEKLEKRKIYLKSREDLFNKIKNE